MKICFLTQNLFTLGGVQRVLSILLKEMVTRGDHDITIIMTSTENKENLFSFDEKIKIIDESIELPNKLGKIKILFLEVNKWLGFLDIKGLEGLISTLKYQKNYKQKHIKFLNNHNFDVVIGVGNVYSILLGEIAPYINAKTIAWNHNTFQNYFTTRGEKNFGSFYQCKLAILNVDKTLVLTNADKITFDQNFKIDSSVLYNPIAEKNCNMSKLDIGNIVFAGRLLKHVKGLDFLLKIVQQVASEYPQIKFTILGDGPDKAWLEKQVQKQKLEKYVNILGNVNNVYDYYSNASLLVQTSRVEGFGMTILEAMACGVPAVSFCNKGPNEIISDGVDGYLIEQDDVDTFSKRVIMLLDNESLRLKMGENAKKRSKDFSVDLILNQFEQQLKF